ncbi:hypothetical protein HDV02_005060 [Globomyces sp. JEL0801]|nr:hypothetical protein HDV02_005060 [Globomyces sp. JEL0801]
MKYFGFILSLTVIYSNPVPPENISKIVNGKKVSSIDKYPWLVGIDFTTSESEPKRKNRQTDVGCGGTLLDANHVLTAAHCSVDTSPSDVTVVTHRLDLSTTIEEESAIQFKVNEILIHPKFTPDLIFDVAVWKVSLVKGDLSQIKQFPRLDDGTQKFDGESLTAAGWGDKKDSANKGSTVLREVQLEVIGRKECKKSEPDLDKSILCAGGRRGKDTCQGDSGGPLFLQAAIPTIVGIVSSGAACGSPIGFYANVTHVLPWIEQVVGRKLSIPAQLTDNQIDTSNQTRVNTSTSKSESARSSSISNFLRREIFLLPLIVFVI